MMASLGNFETLNFRNARGKFGGVGILGTHEMTKSEMRQNPPFISTHVKLVTPGVGSNLTPGLLFEET